MTWTRTSADDGFSNTGAVETSSDGRWTITKEWFADGPSLFDWVLRSTDGNYYETFPTRRAARQAAATHP